MFFCYPILRFLFNFNTHALKIYKMTFMNIVWHSLYRNPRLDVVLSFLHLPSPSLTFPSLLLTLSLSSSISSCLSPSLILSPFSSYPPSSPLPHFSPLSYPLLYSLTRHVIPHLITSHSLSLARHTQHTQHPILSCHTILHYIHV